MFKQKNIFTFLLLVLFFPSFLWASREQKTIKIETSLTSGTVSIDSTNFQKHLLLAEIKRPKIFSRMQLIFDLKVPARSGNYYIEGREPLSIEDKMLSLWAGKENHPVNALFRLSFSNGKEQIRMPVSFNDVSFNTDVLQLFLIFEESSARLPYTLNYEVRVITPVLPVISLVYLLLSILVSFTIFQLLRIENIKKLADINWNNSIVKVISILSHVLIAILLLDEIGLLLKEWNIKAGVFELSRQFIGLQGMKQLIFLANFGLMLPATYTISSKLLHKHFTSNSDIHLVWPEHTSFVRQYSVLTAFFMLIISMIFFLFQTYHWEETGDFSDLIVSISKFDILLIIFIIIPPVSLLFKVLHTYRKLNETNHEKGKASWGYFSLFHMMIVFFLSLTQTMITRVILLLNLMGWGRNLLGKLLTKIYPHKEILIADDNRDTYENQLGIIASSSLWDKWNFVFLTTSTFILLFIFQGTASPYPPTENVYAKSETISFFYMSFMMFYLIPLRRYKSIKSVLWSLYVIFCLHALPIFFPQWFEPALTNAIGSIIDSLQLIFGRVGTMLFLLCTHLLFALKIFAIISWYKIMADNKMNTRVLLLKIIQNIKINHFVMILIVVFFWIFLIVGIGNLHVFKFFINFDWSGLNTLVVFTIVLLILVFMLIIMILLNAEMRDYKEFVVRKGGDDLADQLGTSSGFLRLFKAWHGKSNPRLYGYYFLLIVVFSALVTGAFYLPAYFDARKDKIFWYERFDDYVHYLNLNENSYLAAESDRIYAKALLKDSTLWSQPLSSRKVSSLNDSILALYQHNKIVLLKKETGKVLREIPLTLINASDSCTTENLKISLFKEHFLLFSCNHQLIFMDINDGNVIRIIDGVKHYSTNEQSSLFVYTSDNELLFVDEMLNVAQILKNDQAVNGISSYLNHCYLISGNSLIKTDSTGNILWSWIADPSMNVWIEQLSFDSAYVYALIGGKHNGIVGLSQSFGHNLWFLPDHLPQVMYNNNWGFHDWQQSVESVPDGLIVRKNNDLLMIDPETGKPLISYLSDKRLFDTELGPSALCNDMILNTYGGLLISYDYYSGKHMGIHQFMRPLLQLFPESGKWKEEFKQIVPIGLSLKGDTLILTNESGIYMTKFKRK